MRERSLYFKDSGLHTQDKLGRIVVEPPTEAGVGQVVVIFHRGKKSRIGDGEGPKEHSNH